MPLISIIIPCYNVEKYIMRCFESLRDQTIGLENLELIFVDDASTDHTWEILSQIESNYPENVVLTHFEENQRQGAARNFGLSIARGDYIGFVDSDDWVEPEMYENMLCVLLDSDSDFVNCRHVRDTGKPAAEYISEAKFRDDATPVSYTPVFISSDDDRRRIIVENTFGHIVWDKLYRKSFLLDNAIDFPVHLTYEDIYFGALLSLYVTRAAIIECTYYHYFVNESSTVLKRNESYHLDIFRVNDLKWDVIEQRGFLDKFDSELRFDYLMTFYLPCFKALCLRYDEFPYEIFLELKQKTLLHVPDYTTIPYCQTYVPEIYQLILSLLRIPVTREQLIQIKHSYCAYFGVTG